MRKITYLLSLFLLMVGTAMAQTFVTPNATKVLTAEALRGLTTETPIVLCPVQESNYRSWYDGATGTYATSGSTVTEANVFVWVPILSGGAATGTGYLKKRTAESSDVAYLQSANTTTFGAQATAQVFYAVKPYIGGTGNAQIGDATSIGNLIANYNVENLVRLVCGSAEGTTWFNFNGTTYNNGKGVWTAMEVRDASGMTEADVLSSLDQLSNNKAYTLVTVRGALAGNEAGTAAQPATLDDLNTRFHWAILKNDRDKYFLYNVAAGKFLNMDNSLVDNPTDNISFVANTGGNYSGTFTLYYDNTHFINISGGVIKIDNWGPGGTHPSGCVDDGNAYTIAAVADFEPSEELLQKLNSVDVTFRYIVGTSLYLEVTRPLPIGTVLAAANFTDVANDYVTVESWDKTDAIEDDVTVTVTCSAQELPFVVSESYDNATWYMVNMHSNENNYMWTATATDGTPALTVVNKGSVYKETAVPDDSRLWCFVGDICGFKIYNKAVGDAYTMNKTTDADAAVTWGAAAEGTMYHLHKTASTSIPDGYCFLPVGHRFYLNHRQPNIQGWTSRDEGSTCFVFAPDNFLLRYAADVAAGPVNALGVAQYFNTEGKFDAFNAVVDAANANHFDATATADLAAFLTDYASDEANATANSATVTDGGYYRLMNAAYKTYLTSGLDGTTNALWAGLAAAEAPSTAGTIVKAVADGTNYKLYVQGLEVGQVAQSTGVNLTEGGVFTISNTGSKFSLKDASEGSTDYSYLHCDGYKRVVGWVRDEEPSKWYMIPATSVALNLNRVDEKTYATTYLPFDVTLPVDGSVKAYIVTTAADGVATVAEVADVPAGQGVILEGQTATTTAANLTIATATADCTGNLLEGTNPRFTIEETAKTNYYILGNGTNGVGFYHPNSTTLKENRAFLPAANVTIEGVNGFRLDFGGQTTAIDSVEVATEGNAAVYDLSGRRVVRPAKGIYVKNGKKVYVK